jgi:hypothetical protein
MRKDNGTINFIVMRFRYFLGVEGISYDGRRRGCLYYAGFFSEYHGNVERISCQDAKNVCAEYLIRAFVFYMARIGNVRHLFAMATKRISKNFISQC